MDFYIIFDDFFEKLFNTFENTPILQNVCFSYGEPMIFKIRRFHFPTFFSMFFQSLFGIDFYMDFLRFREPFWVHFASLFDPLASFLDTFTVTTFSWFSDAVLDRCWSKIYKPGRNPRRHFFQKKNLFFRVSFQGLVFHVFHEFWINFAWILV